MGTLQGNPKAFFQKAGASLIDFLHYLVKNTRVCQPSPDRLRGGISILSWSLGTAYAIPIFLQSSMVDKAAYAAVEPYFTTLIAYGNFRVTGFLKVHHLILVFRSTLPGNGPSARGRHALGSILITSGAVDRCFSIVGFLLLRSTS